MTKVSLGSNLWILDQAAYLDAVELAHNDHSL